MALTGPENDKSIQTVAAAMKALRESTPLGLAAMARQLGKSPDQVSRYETGNMKELVPLDTLADYCKICRQYGADRREAQKVPLLAYRSTIEGLAALADHASEQTSGTSSSQDQDVPFSVIAGLWSELCDMEARIDSIIDAYEKRLIGTGVRLEQWSTADIEKSEPKDDKPADWQTWYEAYSVGYCHLIGGRWGLAAKLCEVCEEGATVTVKRVVEVVQLKDATLEAKRASLFYVSCIPGWIEARLKGQLNDIDDAERRLHAG